MSNSDNDIDMVNRNTCEKKSITYLVWRYCTGSYRRNLMSGWKRLGRKFLCKLRQQHIHTLSLKQWTRLFFPPLLLLLVCNFCF